MKVLDFGIAKLVTDGAGQQARRPAPACCWARRCYMSPEQCRGAGQVDHRTDIYSLGCILFEMLTGPPALPVRGRRRADRGAHRFARAARGIPGAGVEPRGGRLRGQHAGEGRRSPAPDHARSGRRPGGAGQRRDRAGGHGAAAGGGGAEHPVAPLSPTVRLETPAPAWPAMQRTPLGSGPIGTGHGGTTFSATVGESMTLRPRRSRPLAWAVGGAVVALGAAALYLALESNRRPDRTSAATAIPVAVPPPPAPARPFPAHTTALGTRSGARGRGARGGGSAARPGSGGGAGRRTHRRQSTGQPRARRASARTAGAEAGTRTRAAAEEATGCHRRHLSGQ